MKYKVVIVALLIWLNILTALYFAHNWTEEKGTMLFSYSSSFDTQTEANTVIACFKSASYGDGTFCRIDKTVTYTPQQWGVTYNLPNGTSLYYKNWEDYLDNKPIIPSTNVILSYKVTGINIIAKDNYRFIFYGLLIIDLIIIASTIFIDRHTKHPERVPRRKRGS